MPTCVDCSAERVATLARMKIAIDLQPCQTDSRERGIGRYALGLVAAMQALQMPDLELSLLLDAARPERLRDARRALRARGVDASSAVYAYPAHPAFTDAVGSLKSCAEQLKSRFVAALEPDVLLVTSRFEVGDEHASGYALEPLQPLPTAVIAYDLIPLLFPERYLPEGEFISDWYRQRLQMFRRFDLFLAISESTRRDLIAHLQIEPERIVVIDAGVDDCFQARSADGAANAILAALGITKPFVLMVGNADWRKNCIGALRMFAALPEPVRRAHQLVFTRVGPDVLAALEGPLRALKSSVVVLGAVEESVLADLYASCQVFLFPSLYEGFGLPVLEAMVAGAPVLCAARGALPEVVPTPDALFDPEAIDDAAAVLLRALNDDEFRATLRAGAREHALKFSWARSAERALYALRALAASRTSRPPTGTWQPSVAEVELMADAAEALGGQGEAALRPGLQAIARRGRRRVLLDISEVVRLDARSGIQRVVRNYCTGLAQLAQSRRDFELVPFAWCDGELCTAYSYVREQLGLEIEGEDAALGVLAGDLVFMLDSSWWSPERFNELHDEVRAQGGEVVWMVYDLVPIRTPHVCDPVMPPVFRAWLQSVADSADGCICISHSTEIELQRFFGEHLSAGERRPWTRNLHLGSDLESGESKSATDEGLALRERLSASGYCVALSTVEPRKDYPTILDAFERLWAAGSELSLVIIGKQGWNVEIFCERVRKHPQLGARLHWLDRACDGDVRAFLTGARCLVQASVAEGFGLAVVEAGSLGVPLLLSDIPVFREVAGDEACYFPVGDSQVLASLLDRVSNTAALRRPVGMTSLTWAQSTVQLAERLVGSRPDTADGCCNASLSAE
jgi:glycosyltransferase involved in cell wall biosynthesis